MNFYKRMEIVCRAIPYGKVVSYGRIAFLCGTPQAPRRVGYALSHGRLSEEIPAHRIVNSQGILSGAGAFGPPGTQRALLLKEGVAFLAEDRVDLRGHGWKTGQEDFLLFMGIFEREGI